MISAASFSSQLTRRQSIHQSSVPSHSARSRHAVARSQEEVYRGEPTRECLTRTPELTSQCGDIVKVTPSSKVVGDFAQFMVSNQLSKQDVIDKATTLDFPSSVVEFFQGYLGQPYGGFPEPLRSNIIRGKKRIDERPGLSMKPLDFKKIKSDLVEKYGKHISDYEVQSYCMYPKVFEEYQSFVEKFGDLR